MHYYLLLLLLFFSNAPILSEENNNSDLKNKKATFFLEALEKANKENKSVLLLFCTFQDKCKICKKLNDQIIKEAAFLSFTSNKVVFVKLYIDDLDVNRRLENLQLAREFGLTQKGKPDKLNSNELIDCYPAFVLIDEKGGWYSKFILNEITIDKLISSFEKSLQLYELKKSFLSIKSEDGKKYILEEFKLINTSNLNFMYFADLMIYDIQINKDLGKSEKLSLYKNYYIGCVDISITEKIRAEIKAIDSEQLLGEIGLEFIYLMKKKQNKNAYDYLSKHNAILKRMDLDNIFSFAMHKREQGEIKEAIEILTFTFKDDIYTNSEKIDEETKNKAKAFKRAKFELAQCKKELQIIELSELSK